MLQKILSVAKWIAGVIGGITAIAGIIAFIYTQGQKAEQKKNKDSAVIEVVNETRAIVTDLKSADSLKTIQLTQILSNQKDQSKKIDNLNTSYINHLKMEKKIDELILFLEAEKKNGEIGMSLIPYKPEE